MTTPTETEVKIRLSGKAATLEHIGAAGFRESAPRIFEANTLYDTLDGQLRKKEMLLRLRQAGDKSVITWKGPGASGPHKSRPEVETPIGSTESMSQIFHQLGFEPVFRYEKYRTEYMRPGAAGVITVDETPIGEFLELEGPADWIDETADLLGFSRQQYVLDSYGKLYVADCERRGVQPTHMVFASTPG
jgi:adenylate cyclase, class 2